MFTDKLLVFLEIMVIRLCFTQEPSSLGAVGNAPAGVLGCSPACSAPPSPHAQANWWPQDFTSLLCWRCSLWLTPPFWMKGLSHKLLFLLSFLTLCSQHNVIQSSLPILSNTTLKSSGLCSICAGNLNSQTWSWVLRRLLKPKSQTKPPSQVCRKKKIYF